MAVLTGDLLDLGHRLAKQHFGAKLVAGMEVS
jgi:hypothetical protein